MAWLGLGSNWQGDPVSGQVGTEVELIWAAQGSCSHPVSKGGAEIPGGRPDLSRHDDILKCVGFLYKMMCGCKVSFYSEPARRT